VFYCNDNKLSKLRQGFAPVGRITNIIIIVVIIIIIFATIIAGGSE
jgi:hypothetical protein